MTKGEYLAATRAKHPHDWEIDSSKQPPQIDIWVVDFDVHNGPGCKRCGEIYCQHCTPDWMHKECRP